MMKLVEECSGRGELLRGEKPLGQFQYSIRRYQGITESSGLPIPGLFRTEGSIDLCSAPEAASCIDTPLTLRLEDGRSLGIVLTDTSGRVLSEGHGPSKCLCC
jgi:hypothetical protein